jgi:Ca2+-binding EF-hand superfamily protein
MFNQIDVNKDGTLSLEELIESIKQNKTTMPEDLESYLKAIDTDHNGSISFEEFVLAT